MYLTFSGFFLPAQRSSLVTAASWVMSFAVGAVAGRGVIGVDDGHYATFPGNLVTAEAGGITFAVPPFVVLKYPPLHPAHYRTLVS